MAVTETDHVSFPVRQSQVYTHVSKLMDFPSSYEMALSHMEGSVVSCPTRLSSSWRWRPQIALIEKNTN